MLPMKVANAITELFKTLFSKQVLLYRTSLHAQKYKKFKAKLKLLLFQQCTLFTVVIYYYAYILCIALIFTGFILSRHVWFQNISIPPPREEEGGGKGGGWVGWGVVAVFQSLASPTL